MSFAFAYPQGIRCELAEAGLFPRELPAPPSLQSRLSPRQLTRWENRMKKLTFAGLALSASLAFGGAAAAQETSPSRSPGR